MKLKIYNLLFLLLLTQSVLSQNTFSGFILELENNQSLEGVEIHAFYGGLITKTNSDGNFKFSNYSDTNKVIFYKEGYDYKVATLKANRIEKIFLNTYSVKLNEVIVVGEENRFSNTQLNDIVGNSIFAGKKTNKIMLDNMFGDKSGNNARHVYNKIGGLNIFQNDDAGLQLNIGGRGLNPGRSSNFNIRQNNYDISADVLGYPESYYTPPAEALKEIQLVRGAASLQYGTQFGGLVNFVFKKPPTKDNVFQILSRNTIGSNSLFTNFTSISERDEKFSYYAFLNYKTGDGFRSNSNFESTNLFSYFDIQISKKLNICFEFTYLTYLAQQAGGLTDKMFNENIFQSNRERNWFKIDWLLYNSKFLFDLNEKDNISVNLFSLDANRFALGNRNRVDQTDPLNERDLIKGFFNNYGLESRYLNHYHFLNKQSVLLTGIKYYTANNISKQGPGSADYNANFNFAYDEYLYYPNQSLYNYPNLNTAFFAENILYLDSNLSITPGLRYEYIDTRSEGYYRNVYLNLVEDPQFDTTIFSNNQNIRSFFLFGTGLSYKTLNNYEFYSNISQNYRSVTFSDITISSPTFLIDPNISDESGYSYDIGLRGIYKSFLRFDLNYFGLLYNNRIGFLQKKVEFRPRVFAIKTEKTNVGDALMNGMESIIDLNFKNVITNLNLGGFINYAFTKSEYLNSESQSLVGNNVEFVPIHNLKCGINTTYKRLSAAVQLTYLSDQYSDASNSIESNISGILGIIPSYHILDFYSSINFKNTKLFFGINNLLNNYYFTRRATGYPGPGIIPAQTRSYYFTLELSY